MARTFRVGQIVPSSNTTMETEVPAILRAREAIGGERFTFHSSRMRMQKVERDELARMDDESLRCAAELADARMDAIGYACLVAIMARGLGYHRDSEKRLGAIAAEMGGPAPIITSAGALIDGLQALRARRIAVLTPYMKPLTKLVIDYIEHEGFEVTNSISLEIPDNLEVGRRDPMATLDAARDLDLAGADVLVLSACVQMPSLQAIAEAEQRFGLPVVSAATCTARQLLIALGVPPLVPGFGAALSTLPA